MEVLKDGGLAIRPALVTDATQLATWWNDGAVMVHAGFPRGIGTTAKKVAESLSGDGVATGRRLLLLRGAEAIGEMYYSIEGHDTAEIGIKICQQDFQGQGLGKRYLRLLIDSLFAQGIQKIRLDTMLENQRAQHVYESLGFQKVGVRKDCWQDQLGVWRTAVDYELLPKNWQRPRQNR